MGAMALAPVIAHNYEVRLYIVPEYVGPVSISTTDSLTRCWTILLWTNNMEGWSVARLDSLT